MKESKDSKYNTVYIGLGSNQGKKKENIKKALVLLKKYVVIKKISSLYKTEPVGVKDRHWFLNCVVEGKTYISPLRLINFFQKIERALGRVRKKGCSQRTIDVDLLLYSNKRILKDNLIVPHAELHKRRFVLIPLLEINPNLTHPVLNKKLKDILKGIKTSHQRVFLKDKINYSH